MRGYHVYQGIWDADLGEQLPCQREPMNSKDPFAGSLLTTRLSSSFAETMEVEGTSIDNGP